MLRLVIELEDKGRKWGQILKRATVILQGIHLSRGFGMVFRQEKAAVLQENKVDYMLVVQGFRGIRGPLF